MLVASSHLEVALMLPIMMVGGAKNGVDADSMECRSLLRLEPYRTRKLTGGMVSPGWILALNRRRRWGITMVTGGGPEGAKSG